jgi:hypothetical protein
MLATLLATAASGDSRCPDQDAHAARIDVTIDLAKKSVAVVPDSITLYIGQDAKEPRRACWVIAGLRQGDELSFEDKAGTPPNLLPQMQRAVKAQKPYVNSGNPAKAGVWRYQVSVRDASGATVATVDPEVIIGY